MLSQVGKVSAVSIRHRSSLCSALRRQPDNVDGGAADRDVQATDYVAQWAKLTPARPGELHGAYVAILTALGIRGKRACEHGCR